MSQSTSTRAPVHSVFSANVASARARPQCIPTAVAPVTSPQAIIIAVAFVEPPQFIANVAPCPLPMSQSTSARAPVQYHTPIISGTRLQKHHSPSHSVRRIIFTSFTPSYVTRNVRIVVLNRVVNRLCNLHGSTGHRVHRPRIRNRAFVRHCTSSTRSHRLRVGSSSNSSTIPKHRRCPPPPPNTTAPEARHRHRFHHSPRSPPPLLTGARPPPSLTPSIPAGAASVEESVGTRSESLKTLVAAVAFASFWLLAAAVATGGCRNGLFVVYVVTSILYALFLRAGCVHPLPASALSPGPPTSAFGSVGTVTVLIQEPETPFVVVAFFSLIGSVAAAAAFATSQIGTGNTFPLVLASAGAAAAVITDATVTAAALVTAGHGSRIQASSQSSTRSPGFQSTQSIQSRGSRHFSTSKPGQSLGSVPETSTRETPLLSFAMFKDVWGIAIAQSWAIVTVVAVAAHAPEVAALVAAAVSASLLLLRGYQAFKGLFPPPTTAPAPEARHRPSS